MRKLAFDAIGAGRGPCPGCAKFGLPEGKDAHKSVRERGRNRWSDRGADLIAGGILDDWRRERLRLLSTASHLSSDDEPRRRKGSGAPATLLASAQMIRLSAAIRQVDCALYRAEPVSSLRWMVLPNKPITPVLSLSLAHQSTASRAQSAEQYFRCVRHDARSPVAGGPPCIDAAFILSLDADSRFDAIQLSGIVHAHDSNYP